VQSATSALEMLFIGNWSDGIDLLALDGTSGHLTQPGRDLQGARVAIDLLQVSPVSTDPNERRKQIGERKVPDDFAYVVLLPKRLSQAVLNADRAVGPDWDAAIRRLLQPK